MTEIESKLFVIPYLYNCKWKHDKAILYNIYHGKGHREYIYPFLSNSICEKGNPI